MPIICDECGERVSGHWGCYCEVCEDKFAEDLESYEEGCAKEAELAEENEKLHERIEELEEELKNK